MLIEIYSDVVCPWCWIGKRRLERALEQYPKADDVTLRFVPFQLDPTAPPTPMPVVQAYAQKFGGEARALQMIDRVTAIAAEVGLEYHLDIAQRANTFDAHRMLWFAGQRDLRAGSDGSPAGVQIDLKERLLRAYFADGLDIGDRDVLVACAVEIGLDGDDVRRFLDSEDGVSEVDEELAAGRRAGITAVPTFVFHPSGDEVPGAGDEGFMLSGAQEPELLLRVLERLGG